jgi:hypothetical protein
LIDCALGCLTLAVNGDAFDLSDTSKSQEAASHKLQPERRALTTRLEGPQGCSVWRRSDDAAASELHAWGNGRCSEHALIERARREPVGPSQLKFGVQTSANADKSSREKVKIKTASAGFPPSLPSELLIFPNVLPCVLVFQNAWSGGLVGVPGIARQHPATRCSAQASPFPTTANALCSGGRRSRRERTYSSVALSLLPAAEVRRIPR